MVYNTGSRDDWDHVSRITGDPTWAWDAMAHYRDLNQKYVPPNDGHDDVSQKQESSPLFLPSTPDKSVSPVGTQSQRDGVYQSSRVSATHRFKGHRDHC